MIRFLADENFNNQVLRGLQRRVLDVEILRVQDTELAAMPDPLVLEWAAENNYIVLSHDVNTMRGYFYERVEQEFPVPGLFLIHGDKPVSEVIDSLELVLKASELEEWEGKVEYLPF